MGKAGRGAKGGGRPGRLRIIGGEWRSRVLPVPDVDGLRPTPERVRETLFNWLTAQVEGARCLDLCAGTGVLGFEALSRGAAHVTLVERAPRAVDYLRRAAEGLQAGEAARIVQADARAWLAETEPAAHGLAFLDPPYGAALLPELCRLLAERGWLTPGARVYLEHDRAAAPPELPAGWDVIKNKNAGNVTYLLVAVP